MSIVLLLAGSGPDAGAAAAAPARAATAAVPGPPAAAFESAQALLRQGSAAEALALAESQPGEQAREPRWRFLRGLALVALGRTHDAAEVYTRLTEEFPDLAEPHNNLAVLRAAQGRLDEARALLEGALRADPAQREARENLGDIHLRLAIRHWEAAASGAGRAPAEAGLARKLRLARELAAGAP